LKTFHFNAIINAMRTGNSCAISEVSQTTGLSIPTVSKAIDFGIKAGVIVPSVVAPSTGGRKAQLYYLNAAYLYTLYFALDNEALHYTLKDFAQHICEAGQKTIELKEFCKEIDTVFKSIRAKYTNVKIICVAVPAITDDGKIVDWYYNPSLNGFDLKEYLMSKHKVDAVIENDMKLTASAAVVYAVNKENATLATLQFGHNGIGLGQIVNGKILRGANGFAGEISFLRDEPCEPVTPVYCAKVVRSVIVMLNPELIVFYTSDTQSKIDQIMSEAVKHMPAYAVPRVLVSDRYLKDIFTGLEIISQDFRKIQRR